MLKLLISGSGRASLSHLEGILCEPLSWDCRHILSPCGTQAWDIICFSCVSSFFLQSLSALWAWAPLCLSALCPEHLEPRLALRKCSINTVYSYHGKCWLSWVRHSWTLSPGSVLTPWCGPLCVPSKYYVKNLTTIVMFGDKPWKDVIMGKWGYKFAALINRAGVLIRSGRDTRGDCIE